MTRQRIVVVGSGFAGVEAIKRLSRACGRSIECVWVTNNAQLVFLPALPEVAGGRLNADDVSFPVDKLAKASNAELIKARASSIDQDHVYLSDGDKIKYDYLILATGAAPAFFNVEGAERYTIPLYSVEAALRIRELARKANTMVIVGAGFVGVEVAAELKHANPDREVVVLDMLDEPIKILGNKRASALVRRELDRLGVRQVYGSRVTRVEEGRVITTKGVIDSELVIWAAGLQANTPELKIGVTRVKGGFVKVDENLRAAERVFVAGDASCITVKGCTSLKMVREAMRQGALAAENILRSIDGRPLRSYKPVITDCRPLAGVTLGPGNGVLILGKSIALRTSLVGWYKEWQRKRFKRSLAQSR